MAFRIFVQRNTFLRKVIRENEASVHDNMTLMKKDENVKDKQIVF